MKIIKLSIENLMKITAAEITPQGNMVIISGKNGQGKTSILNSFAFALGGQKLIPEKPIKEGEDSATVTVDLGEYIVTRRWTANDKSTVKIESKDGAIFKSPQAMLDKIIGDLSFDPLEFTRMPAKNQREILCGLVGLDLDKFSKERKELFDNRTVINRQIKQKEGELAGIGKPEQTLVGEEVSISDLIAEIQVATNNNNRKSEAERKFKEKIDEIEKIDEKIKALQEQKSQLELDRVTELNKFNGIKEIDIAGLKEKLSSAENINKAVREAKAHKEKYDNAKAAFNDLERQGSDLTIMIETLDAQKSDALNNAKFPISGLSVSDDGIIWNGIPFNQASSAEQLKVSLAIAMALNPKLKVIRITDGSLLDSENMSIIEEMAKEKDFQVWVEKVDESGTVGIVVEEGKVSTNITKYCQEKAHININSTKAELGRRGE